MKGTQRAGAVLTILLCMAVVVAAQNPAASATATRNNVSITLYTSGSALVRETLRATLPAAGVENVTVPGIGSRLLPDSVQVALPQSVNLLDQTYSYGLLNPFQLLRAYVGKDITIVVTRLKNGSEVEEPVQATVLAANPGPVWRIDGKIETGLKSNHYIFPSIPANLSAGRSLLLRLQSERAGEESLRLSYLSDGLNWSANYVLDLDPAGESGAFAARALIQNNSGADYRDAAIQLIAGEVRRVSEGVGAGSGGGIGAPRPRFATEMAEVAPVVTQQPFSGYHLYTIQPRMDLRNETSQQVALIPPAHIRVERLYDVNGQVYYNQGPEIGGPQNVPVTLRLKFKNSKANGLGVPLPGGIVRVYRKDESGQAQLVGEDTLPGTAADEDGKLTLGNAFDVVAKSRQTDYRKLGPTSAESAYEITLRNHQAQAVTVTVNEQFNGEWQIVSSSLPYKKTSSSTAQFMVPVPSHGQTILKYQVRIEWAR